MLLWTGDLTNLTSGDMDTFERQLETRRNAMAHVYDTHVVVLPVCGNHEVVWYHGGPSEQKIDKPRDALNKAFCGKYALSTNGPNEEKNNRCCSIGSIVWLDARVKNHLTRSLLSALPIDRSSATSLSLPGT